MKIEKNMSIRDYHDEKQHYSASTLKHGLRSMKQMRYYLDGKLEEKTGSFLDFGNAFETKLLDPAEFKNCVAIFDPQPMIDAIMQKKPDIKAPTMTNDFKDFKVNFEALNADKYIINKSGAESLETIELMFESCMDSPVISKLLSQVEKQVSIFWTDEKTGIKLKTRPDTSRAEKNVIVDVKTTRDASPYMFSKQVNDLKYWLQALIQIEGCLKSGYMDKIDGYFWLAVEKETPYNACLYEFTPEDIERKMVEFRMLLDNIAASEKTGIWPGYEAEASNNFGILTAKIW